MTRPPLLRFVHLNRRSRLGKAVVAADASDPQARRNPLVSGFDVSPVHGRHCICRRCEQLARPAA